MPLTVDPASFQLPPRLADLARGVAGKRVLITGSGKDQGLGQAFALAAGLNGAASVGVHFFGSYADGLETCDLIERHGGHAFPIQADVTNTSDVWAIRSYTIRQMGGLPPDLVICNSGLSEAGYLLGRPPRAVEGESPAMRRARARKDFVQNLTQSTAVINTKMDGFLYMTHLWAAEALHAKRPITFVYVSSRQAIDPGAGVPGYVLANFGVLTLPRVLRQNLGRKADLVTALSVAYPFVKTGMTSEYADNPKVFGRWQPRMLTGPEGATALLQLLARPPQELDDHIFQLNVDAAEGTPSAPGPETAAEPPAEPAPVALRWSHVALEPREEPLPWSADRPLVL